jgi:5-methylthioadenosine/S-adenosylhomocysteine deaminase
MEKPQLLKGGIVLTLDKSSRSGIFDITIKNGKISSIDYEGKTSTDQFLKENPGGKVIDAGGMIIMPGFFNSRLVSAYSLCKMFFRKCSYDNNGSSVSLNLIDRYLAEKVNSGRLSDILELVYKRSLMNGELFVNESSPSFKKFQINDVFNDLKRFDQYLSITAFDLKLIDEPGPLKSLVSAGFRADEDINSYAISSLKRSLQSTHGRLIIDASLSHSAYESVKQTFGKPYINVLAENGLLCSNTLLINPMNITDGEIGIIREKESTILFSPSDFANMSGNLSLAGKLFDSGINMILGTGLTGNDIISELRIMSALGFTRTLSYESLLRSAVTDPAASFGIGNITGSIEKTKSADMIILSLRDIRNSGGMPDLDSETICWHIVNLLTPKDITNVILKGSQIYNRYNAEMEQESLKAASRIAEMSSLLYSAGKLREYKERKLMNKRVEDLSLGQEHKEKENSVFVDMTETGEYVGEGEFKILGNKIEDYQYSRESIPEEALSDLLEIKSFDEDLNLIGDDDETFELPKLGIRLVEAKREDKAGIPEKHADAVAISSEVIEDEFSVVPISTEQKVTKLKRSPLKFGFKEGE